MAKFRLATRLVRLGCNICSRICRYDIEGICYGDESGKINVSVHSLKGKRRRPRNIHLHQSRIKAMVRVFVGWMAFAMPLSVDGPSR